MTQKHRSQCCGQKRTRVRCAQVKIADRKFVEARKFGPPPLSKVETVHEINVGPALSPFCVCFCVEEGASLLRRRGARYPVDILPSFCAFCAFDPPPSHFGFIWLHRTRTRTYGFMASFSIQNPEPSVDFGKRNFADFASSDEIETELRDISRWLP